MKKNKHLNNILFLFSFLQFLFITVKSQNTTEIENHKKYWYYKTRFKLVSPLPYPNTDDPSVSSSTNLLTKAVPINK